MTVYVFELPDDTDRECDKCERQAVEEIEHSLWSWYCADHALYVGRDDTPDDGVKVITL